MFRPIPVLATRRQGFSLVLSLTVMAMLLLLCISVAALMTIELRVARAAVSQARAKLNAMVGARIALGELQRLAGPDQRVTATADILCEKADGVTPIMPGYYRNPVSQNPVTHPRWVGVWNSGRQQGMNLGAPSEAGSVIVRHADGYLLDSRYQPGDWATDKLTSPRMLGWLVSGNEALSQQSSPKDWFTPETPLGTVDSLNRMADFPLLGIGVFGGGYEGQVNTVTGDMLGLRVRRVNIPDQSGQSVGSFAYAVIDEGVKGRINLTNKYSGRQPDATNPADGGYFNLILPQRNLFDTVKAMSGAATPLANHSAWDQTRLSAISQFADLPLAVTNLSRQDADTVRREFYHDITFHAAGVLADVVNGGLRKDLTAFINQGDIADGVGINRSGIVGARGLINGSVNTTSAFASDAYDPPLALIANWYKAGPVTGADTKASPAAPYSPATGAPRILGVDSVVPAYTASASPVITPLLTAYNFSYRIAALSAADQRMRYQKYIYFTIWNPYSVPIIAENLTLTANSRIEANCNLDIPGSTLIYQSPRRAVDYRIPGTTRLEPGQAVTFVPALNQDISSNRITGSGAAVGTTVTINMTRGIPDETSYYLDGCLNYLASDLYTTPLASSAGTYYWTLINSESTNASFALPNPADHYYLRAGTPGNMTTLQQVNFDLMKTPITNGYEFSLETVNVRINPVPELATVQNTAPHGRLRHGFRLIALDEPTTPNSDGLVANSAYNLFMNANVRAPVQSRHPYDRATRIRRAATMSRGIYTSDTSLILDGNSDRITDDAVNTRPFLINGGNAKRFAILDVPRQSLGLHSIGQLQHAPLINAPWAPTLAVGNSLIPPFDSPLDRTTWLSKNNSGEQALWNKFNVIPFSTYLTYVNQAPESIGLLDWSYELNHALWDTYHFSGIPAANSGWNQGNWDLGTTPASAKNSRYEQVAAMPQDAYFRSANFNAYRSAYTLLQKGAFNVNSTSVVAWKSLLGAFRNLRMPTAGAAADHTPFSRHLAPVAAANNGNATTTDAATWGGYRALSDDELQKLAEKIVLEVKSRGPFLSLADFVNRRLKPGPNSANAQSGVTTPYNNWDALENDYLGALQAAIEAAQLNAALTPTGSPSSDPMVMNRTAPDVNDNNSAVGPVNPSHKAKSKFAGAPGYLLQSDLLQQIGAALTARSDTFTVRAAGLADDGTRAYVELVVQRIPEPLIPASGGNGLPVNPKAIAGAATANAVGNQFMGRRFVVVSTKWLTEDSI